MLWNYKISTGLGEKLNSSYIIVLLNPSRPRILPWGTNVITGPWMDTSIIDPSVEIFGLIING